MAKKDTEEKDTEEVVKSKSSSLGGILLLALLLITFPGMIIIALIDNQLNLLLDIGQLWIFAIITSVVIMILLSIFRKSGVKGLKTYLLICLIAAVTALIATFGFHAQWPMAILDKFLA